MIEDKFNAAHEMVRLAFEAGYEVHVAYEDDDDFMYCADLETAWNEITACSSATVKFVIDEDIEYMNVINEPWVEAHETAVDMSANGWTDTAHTALMEQEGYL